MRCTALHLRKLHSGTESFSNCSPYFMMNWQYEEWLGGEEGGGKEKKGEVPIRLCCFCFFFSEVERGWEVKRRRVSTWWFEVELEALGGC